jgi:hypothetical protein
MTRLSCISTLPIPMSDASQYTSKGFSMSGWANTGAVVGRFLWLSGVCWRRAVDDGRQWLRWAPTVPRTRGGHEARTNWEKRWPVDSSHRKGNSATVVASIMARWVAVRRSRSKKQDQRRGKRVAACFGCQTRSGKEEGDGGHWHLWCGGCSAQSKEKWRGGGGSGTGRRSWGLRLAWHAWWRGPGLVRHSGGAPAARSSEVCELASGPDEQCHFLFKPNFKLLWFWIGSKDALLDLKKFK